MKYYLIAGEASGDLHGSNLMRALQQEDTDARFRMWGGDLMQSVGGTLAKHYKELAFMGVLEVLKNLGTIFSNFKFCKKDIRAFQPDVLVLIDYSGFNLRVAKWAKSEGMKVFYFIAPQVWASRSHRVKKIKAYVDELFVILPFEEDFYKKYDYKANFVGHPLLDVVQSFEADKDFLLRNKLTNKPIIALLPGSRKQEITKMLGEMLQQAAHFPEYQFVVAGAPSMDRSFYEAIFQKYPKDISDRIYWIENETYNLFTYATAALVTSGTATLEAALFDIPQVVCYKGNAISYHIAMQFINVEYISLVNLILEKEVVRELIQNDLNQSNLQKELNFILKGEKREEILVSYTILKEKLGKSGASKKAARKMVEVLSHL